MLFSSDTSFVSLLLFFGLKNPIIYITICILDFYIVTISFGNRSIEEERNLESRH